MYPAVANLIMIYSVLRRRQSQHKLLEIGYRQIFWTIEFAFHANIDYHYINSIDMQPNTLFENSVEICCDTFTGIKLVLSKEPNAYLELLLSAVWPPADVPTNTSYRICSHDNIPFFANLGASACINRIIECDINEYHVIEWRICFDMWRPIEYAARKNNLTALMAYSEVGFDCWPGFIEALRAGNIECAVWLGENGHSWYRKDVSKSWTEEYKDRLNIRHPEHYFYVHPHTDEWGHLVDSTKWFFGKDIGFYKCLRKRKIVEIKQPVIVERPIKNKIKIKKCDTNRWKIFTTKK